MKTQSGPWGTVSADELYTLEALRRRLGIRDAALRAARRAGLPVYYKHGRGFVHGRDWINYVCSANLPEAVHNHRPVSSCNTS